MTSASAPFHSLRQTLCHASRTFLLAFALLCLAPRAAWAQSFTDDNGTDYATLEQFFASLSAGGTYTVYVNDDAGTLSGVCTIGDGQIVRIMSSTSGTQRTITRNATDAQISIASGGTLQMTDIILDGGSTAATPITASVSLIENASTNTLTLDNCKIQNCAKSYTAINVHTMFSKVANGGGLNSTVALTIAGNTVFDNCTTRMEGSSDSNYSHDFYCDGGGIFVNGALSITGDVVFSNCSTWADISNSPDHGNGPSDYVFGSGGGIFAYGDVTITGDVTFTDCTTHVEGTFDDFDDNGCGGGLFSDGVLTIGGDAVFSNCSATFEGSNFDDETSGNSERYCCGGGLYVNNNVSITGSASFSDCSVEAEATIRSYMNEYGCCGGGLFAKGNVSIGVDASFSNCSSEYNTNSLVIRSTYDGMNGCGGGLCADGNVSIGRDAIFTDCSSHLEGSLVGYRGSGCGGGICAMGPDLMVSIGRNALFTRCTALMEGAIIQPYVTNASHEGNYLGSGGGIYCAGANSATHTLTITGVVTFTECTARAVISSSSEKNDYGGCGGGIFVNNLDVSIGGDASFEDCTASIVPNSASRYYGNGGGIHAKTLTIEGEATFSGCEANDGNYGGGGIYGANTITFNDNASISYCSATQGGGGIYGANTITFNDNASISYCSATQGGGVYADRDVVFNGASNSITYNTATFGYGGGIKGREVAFNNGTNTISYNTANTGGGINGSVTFNAGTNNTVSYNTAYVGGGIVGVILAYGDSHVFTNNTAGMMGGAMYVRDGTVLTNTVLGGGPTLGNSAVEAGGGLCSYALNNCIIGDNVEISYNTAMLGGGVAVPMGLVSSTGNVHIHHNTAGSRGGGICIQCESYSTRSRFSSGTVISQNTAGNYNNGDGGGGIYVQATKNRSGTADNQIPMLLDGVTLSGNTAYGRGGGLYVNEPGTTLVDVWRGPAVQLRNCTVTGNQALADPSNSTHDLGNGGGIYAHGSKIPSSDPYTDGYLKVVGGTIAGNQTLRNGCPLDHYCIGNGGGVYAYAGTIMLSGVAIGADGNANSAYRNGGGVFVNEHADVTINGATNIAYNTAVNGAGIYTLGNLTMDGSTFTVNNNTATGYGGGINISHADVNDPEEIGFLGTMSYSVDPSDPSFVDPGAFNYNIYNASNALVGSFPFDGSDYEDLLAPGSYTVRLSKTDGISDFSSLASLTLAISDIDGSITPNGGAPIANETDITFTTFTDGYEICTFEVTSPADLGGTLTMKNGTTLSGNSAAYGGGLFVGTHTTAELLGATIGGSTADKNTATTKGGGVYKLGTLKVGGGGVTVTDNQSGTAKAYVTDNVYIPTTAAEPYVLVSGTFDCGSSIGITKTKTDHTYLDDDNYTAVRTVVATNETPGSGHAETAFRRNVFFDDTDKYRVWSFNFAQSSGNYTEDNCYFIETWRSFANASDFTGSGPYEVSSAAGLAYLAQQVNNGTNYVGTVINQTTDLDLSGHYWEPVGTSDIGDCGIGDNAFAGIFNGNGHFIYNASCTQLPLKDLGLFGNVTGTLKHVFALGSNFTYILDEAGGGLGGIVGKTTDLIDGCEASGVTLTGSATAANTATAGGIAGKVASGGEVRNSFAVGNTIALGASGSIASAGGLAGSIASGGAVRNCYAKNNTLDGTAVGALVGNNEGTLANAYSDATTGTLVGTGTAGSNVYAAGATDATYTYTATIGADNLGYQYADNTVNSVAMFKQLSANATALGAGYAQWARPGLAEINEDLPVLLLDAYDGSVGSFSSVGTYNGSADVLQYGGTARDGDQLNSALTRTGTGTNCLFVYGDVTAAPTTAAASYTQSKVSIYEHASITAPGTLKDFAQTYVGVTFDNAAADAGIGAMSTDQMNGLGSQSLYRDWHMLSSPLSNAPIGFDYGSDNNGSGPQHNPWTGNDSWTRYWMQDYASADGYFPTSRGSLFTEGQVFISGSDEYNHRDVYQYGMDLYCWSEPDYHWINFKRNGNDHWSSEEPHNHIDYFGSGTNVNEGYLLEGKGYLASICKETFLQSHGSLNSGTDFKTRLNLTKSGAKCTGWNLVGNPFHSYLSFDALATANTAVLGTDALYVVYEAEGYNTSGNGTLGNGYLYYPYSGSPGGAYARPYLHPHQGFFVFAESEDKLTFNESTMAMSRATVGANGNFRENRAAYPLVNLFLTSEHGCSDVCVVEFNRPEWGGAYKQKALRMGNGQLYAYHDGNEYAALFATAEAQRIPVYFEAKESDTYTLHWNTANGDFSQLILVDNMTGVQYDMLRNDSYSFSGTEDDYKSRFYICFAVLGMDEFEDDTSPGGTTFAFFDGSQWVVTNTGNGPAQLDLIDLQGRVLHRATLGEGGQTRVSLPEVAKGMYLLRRSSANGTQVQKIIIK